jgi:serine/threonine-protein kinase CHEK2
LTVLNHDFSDLVIDQPHVSNHHCLVYRVVCNDHVCVFLRDLSTNGTFVNEALVGCNRDVQLQDEDEVAVSENARFLFQAPSPIRRTFTEQYTVLNSLGKGHLGQVYACVEKSTGRRFAVKRYGFRAGMVRGNVEEGIMAEMTLMGLRHENIVFIKEAFSDRGSSSLVTQIAEEGDLFGFIVRKSKLSEDEARHIFKQLFDAVKYLVSALQPFRVRSL